MRRILFVLLLILGTPMALAQAPGGGSSELDRAFAALRDSSDEMGGRLAETAIRQIWARQATPAVALLMNRGVRNMRRDQPADALEDFDAALLLEPGWADAWHWRAQAHAARGDMRAAAADLREALRIEPRHFPSLITLSRLQEEAGDHAGALRAHRAVLEMHPHLPGGAARLRELTRRAEGESM